MHENDCLIRIGKSLANEFCEVPIKYEGAWWIASQNLLQSFAFNWDNIEVRDSLRRRRICHLAALAKWQANALRCQNVEMPRRFPTLEHGLPGCIRLFLAHGLKLP